MRKIINILIFLLSLVIPLIVLTIISNISTFRLTPFIATFSCLIGLFGYEVMQNKLGNRGIRQYLSTRASKVLFIFGMAGLLFLGTLVVNPGSNFAFKATLFGAICILLGVFYEFYRNKSKSKQSKPLN